MGLVAPLAIAIRLVAYRATGVVIRAHLAIAVVGVIGATRPVYGYEEVVYALAVALRIAVGE